MASAELEQKYALAKPYLVDLEDRIRGALAPFCRENGFPLVSRVKQLESIVGKLALGRYKKWSELDDLVGFTIIVPHIRRERMVMDWIRQEFSVEHVKVRGGGQKDPSVFRYDSTRVYCRLKRPTYVEGNADVWQQIFEVQVQTAFEHAWASATHDLTYKGKEVDWKALRLSAQLKAAVEQLDLLVAGFDDAMRNVDESRWPDIIARRRILFFVKKAVNAKIVPQDRVPLDNSRFSESALSLFRGATGSMKKKWEPIACTRGALILIAKKLRAEPFPKSISLLEFFVLALVEGDVLVPNEFRGALHVPAELLSLSPRCSDFKNRFDVDG